MEMDIVVPPFATYILAAIHVCGLIAALHAVLTVRTSQGALAWAISLFFMPYLTLLPYLVFGRSGFYAYVEARREADTEMHVAMSKLNWRPWVEEAVSASELPAYQQLRALPRLGNMPCLANNHVALLINGEATFAAIFKALASAKQVILIQFFIVKDDDLGRRLRDILLERAAAGVSVYFLYDGIGSHSLPRRYIDSLRNGGVQMHAFPTGGGILNRFQLNFRNHRKIVVIDGERGFVGGHNVGDEYLGKRPPLSPWRDTHIDISGPVVACLQESFAEDWFWSTRQLPKLLLADVFSTDGVMCKLITSGPADPDETCSLMFVEAVQSAKERIWITSPYFIPDESLVSALRLAVIRGVDVRILIPSRRDHHIVFAASNLYAFEAVRAGVRVFRYQPGFIHQKVMLIDDYASAVGSANLDNRSFRLNFEITLLTIDNDFAAQVEKMLVEDFSQSIEIRIEDRKHIHRLQKLGMRIARLLSPIL